MKFNDSCFLLLLHIGFSLKVLKILFARFFHTYLTGKTRVVLKFEGAGRRHVLLKNSIYSQNVCFSLGMDIKRTNVVFRELRFLSSVLTNNEFPLFFDTIEWVNNRMHVFPCLQKLKILLLLHVTLARQLISILLLI